MDEAELEGDWRLGKRQLNDLVGKHVSQVRNWLAYAGAFSIPG